jgi:uncharacterized protein YndB with AHSA1/START domain
MRYTNGNYALRYGTALAAEKGNRTMPHFINATEIEASPEAVWDVVSDADRIADWFTPIEELRESNSVGELTESSTLKIKLGGRIPPGQKMTVQEAVTARKLRFTIGPSFAHALGIAMQVELSLKPKGEFTEASLDFICHPVLGRAQLAISGIDLDEHAKNSTRRLKDAVEQAQ